MTCEVLTPAGNWSSYPPHKHDEDKLDENELEEIYYFELAQGLAARMALLSSGSTGRRDVPSTSSPKSATAMSCSYRTVITVRPWPPPGTTSTT